MDIWHARKQLNWGFNMPTAPIATDELPPYLLPTSDDPTSLNAEEIEKLWAIVKNIATTWAPDSEPLHQRSQWVEFLDARTNSEPSYLAEYRNGLAVLAELPQSMAMILGSSCFP
jgi:hypothetical protein